MTESESLLTQSNFTCTKNVRLWGLIVEFFGFMENIVSKNINVFIKNLHLLFEYFQCLHFKTSNFSLITWRQKYIEGKSTICNVVMTFLINGFFTSIISYKTHVGRKNQFNTGRSFIYKMCWLIYHLILTGCCCNNTNFKTCYIIFITATPF